jgi:cell division protein FtsI (penicillin-binding protein 3)
MATFYNALANKGRMVKPRFCKAIKVNGIYEELPVQVINEQICSQQTAETLRDLLIGVVEGGTGDNIKNDTYLIAGKTGTAVTSPKAVTSNATFVGFFPADKPKYTCLVMMEDIKMFGRNAAPVFQDIADCVVSLDKDLDCRPTMRKRAELLGTNNTILANPTTAKTKQAELRHVYNILGIDKKQITMNSDWCVLNTADDGSEEGYGSYEIRKGVIPNCYGMTIKDALLLCRSLGIDVTFEGYGKVYSQEPKARTPITSKGKVHLKLRTKK